MSTRKVVSSDGDKWDDWEFDPNPDVYSQDDVEDDNPYDDDFDDDDLYDEVDE